MKPEKTYTIEDVACMECHAELIDGGLVIQDMTSTRHNETVEEILFALKSYIRQNGGKCRTFHENVALNCNELTDYPASEYYLPDIMLVCDPSIIKDDGIHGAPDLVIEVTSPATRKNDFTSKLHLYNRIGVKEYWIIDLQKHAVFKYLHENDYEPEHFIHPDKVPVSIFDGKLELDVSRII